MEDPSEVLKRIAAANSGTAENVEKAYNRTYPREFFRAVSLKQDLLLYYGHTHPYLIAMAALDHKLTKAEQLFLFGTGDYFGVDRDGVVRLLNEVWGAGKISALRGVEGDWQRYIRNQSHWSNLITYWSDLPLADALEKSFRFHFDRRVQAYVRELRNVQQPLEDERKADEWKDMDREMERLTTPILQAMKGSIRPFFNDRDHMQEALHHFHRVWETAIGKADSEPKKKHLQDSYTAQVKFVQAKFFAAYRGDKTLEPLFIESPTLADEFYALLYPGWGSRRKGSAFSFKEFGEIEALLLHAWVEGGLRLNELIEDANREKRVGDVVVRPRFSIVEQLYDPRYTLAHDLFSINEITRKRIYTMTERVENSFRGFHCLQVELNPNLAIKEALQPKTKAASTLSDSELSGAYKMLTLSGISRELRNSVLALYLDRTDARNDRFRIEHHGRRHNGRTFLAYLAYLTGEYGDYYYKFQTVLDPTLDGRKRAYRMEVERDAGSNWFTASLRDFTDEVRRLDSAGAVNATIASVRERADPAQAKRQRKLYGLKNTKQLAGLQEQEFETRVTALHNTDETLNLSVVKLTEWLAEAAIIYFLPPVWWVQLAAAVAGKATGMVVHEGLSDTRYTLNSRDNVKDLVTTAIGTLLVAPVDFRGRISKVFEPSEMRILSGLKESNRMFAGEMVLNGFAGGAEAAAKIVPGVALDVLLRHRDWDSQAFSSAAHTLFADVVGKAILPIFGSMTLNPQAINNLTSLPDNLKINVVFKMMLAAPAVIKIIEDDPAADLNSVLTTLGQKMFGALIKGGASAVSSNRENLKTVAEMDKRYGPKNARTAEGKEIIGHTLIGTAEANKDLPHTSPKPPEVTYLRKNAEKTASPAPVEVPAEQAGLLWKGLPPKGAGFRVQTANQAIPQSIAMPTRAQAVGSAAVRWEKDNPKAELTNYTALKKHSEAVDLVATQLSQGPLKVNFEMYRAEHPKAKPLEWADSLAKSSPALHDSIQSSAKRLLEEDWEKKAQKKMDRLENRKKMSGAVIQAS